MACGSDKMKEKCIKKKALYKTTRMNIINCFSIDSIYLYVLESVEMGSLSYVASIFLDEDTKWIWQYCESKASITMR